jgi:hypothetical protein
MRRVLLACIVIAAFSIIGSAQQYTFYFPHIANGTYPGGQWKTTIFLTNAAGSTASGAVTLTASDGSAFNIQFFDDQGRPVGSGNTIPFQLGPGETRKMVSSGEGTLDTGFATISSNTAVLGTAMFTQFGDAGQMLGEAGVPLAIPLGKQAIFVDTVNGFHTGVAIANPNPASLEIHLELLNQAGQLVMSQVRNLGAFQHFALFVSELFPSAPPMIGRLQFYCTNPMVSVGLRFNPGFALFTTLPPVAVVGLIWPEEFNMPAVLRRDKATELLAAYPVTA